MLEANDFVVVFNDIEIVVLRLTVLASVIVSCGFMLWRDYKHQREIRETENCCCKKQKKRKGKKGKKKHKKRGRGG